MSPAPIIVGPEEENRRQGKYAWLLVALVALALVATAYLTQDAYDHPTRPSDCESAQDYTATCARATSPAPREPPSDTALYLGTLATAIIAVLLIRACWDASVTKQAELVTTFAGSTPSKATAAVGAAPVPVAATAAKTAPVAAPVTASPLKAHPVAGKNERALVKAAPTTIVHNRIAPDMIAPPKAEPKKGVDPKKLGGAK